MKIEKYQPKASSTLVSSDDVVLANKYEARRAREELERRSVTDNPYMRAKIAKLFRELSGSIGVDPLKARGHSLARPRDLREGHESAEAAMAHLEAIKAVYLAEPLTVSRELSRSHPAPEYVGEEL